MLGCRGAGAAGQLGRQAWLAGWHGWRMVGSAWSLLQGSTVLLLFARLCECHFIDEPPIIALPTPLRSFSPRSNKLRHPIPPISFTQHPKAFLLPRPTPQSRRFSLDLPQRPRERRKPWHKSSTPPPLRAELSLPIRRQRLLRLPRPLIRPSFFRLLPTTISNLTQTRSNVPVSLVTVNERIKLCVLLSGRSLERGLSALCLSFAFFR